MNKVNRRKSLQLGLATLSLATILSGCNPKKNNASNNQTNNDIKMIESLLKTNERTFEIEKILEISDKLNEDLKKNNLLGELKEVNGVEYYNYNIDNMELLNLDNYSFEELLIFGENIENLTEVQKLYLRAYMNNWLYHNNLFINYENLERAIISMETGKDFVPLQEDENDKFYLLETKEILEEESNKDLIDYEIVENYYNISEEAAKDIVTLTINMPMTGYMVTEMTDGKTKEFGPEDYIPELNKKIKNNTTIIRPMNWKYYEDVLNEEKSINNNHKTKIRK